MNLTIEKKLYRFKRHTTNYEECIFNPDADLTVVYIHGLQSNPWARKVEKIKSISKNLKLNFYRCELLGHGLDEKNFSDCDFEIWKEQLRDIIEHRLTGSLLVVGHCVGGWLGMCMAEEYPQRIKGFLSLATAPDLIKQLIARSTPEQRQILADTGFVEASVEKYHYVFTQKLWTSFHVNDLTQKEKIDIGCPVHLIHGQQDNFVNWDVILKLSDKISYPQTVVKLLKKSNHHLQDPVALQEIEHSLTDLYTLIQKSGK